MNITLVPEFIEGTGDDGKNTYIEFSYCLSHAAFKAYAQ